MRIKFEKLATINGKVYVNFGSGFKEYEISDVKDSGITIPEDCTDYSLIQIKGSSVILNNLDVISNIKTSDENSISPEDITGIVLKDFNGTFDKSLLKTYPKLTSVTIPNNIKTIKAIAFKGCSSLTSIIIPSSVISIGNGAFKGCSGLVDITIPDSVTSIGGGAFSDCLCLTEINIPDNVTYIGSSTFYSCSKLKSIAIPDGITTISNMTFALCTSLTSVAISDSVISIDGYAFMGCDSLMNINYKGTEEQWNAIKKSKMWNSGCPADMVINYNYTE